MVKHFFLFLIFTAIIITGCSGEDKSGKINLAKREPVKVKSERLSENVIRIALGGMITPKEGYAYYKHFIDYIAENTGMNVELVDRQSYAEINNLVKSGEADAAFVCGGPYVEGHDEFGMELLVAPQAYGGTVYYSYIIVAGDSPVKKFEDLRGKKFAFTDPMSNTGKIVPTYMLAKMGETPDSFFKKHIFAGSHDKSIEAVAQGIVDGAAVDSLIWEYFNRVNPRITSQTRIIRKSGPYGIPPVVVRKGLDRETKEKLREIFLNADKNQKGREILKGMMIDRFVNIDDSAYDSIRAMKSWLAGRDSSAKNRND